VQDLRYHSPLSERFIEAGVQAGYARTDDFNGPRQRGFGLYQVTQDNGRRCSTAYAFLRPALERPNLTLLTRARVQSIRLENGIARGVVATVKGRQQSFEAGETVLAGGAINSPQLLMLSGIGRPDDLRLAGIEPLHEMAGVGQNLQDHLDICTLVGIKGKQSYDHINEFMAGLRYLLTRGGPGSSNVAEAGAFVASDLAQDDRPDIQLHFVPALLDDHGRNRMEGYGMTIHACNLRPTSRGEIRLSTDNPDQAPLIFARYMSTEFDRRMMVECARLGRRIFEQEAFADCRSQEIFPGAQHQDDEALLEFVRRKAETIYHPVGTCKMGSDDLAVVDPQLRVHGIDGLRVCDASIIPSLVSGNTNAPTIMIAERCAAWMLENSKSRQSVPPAAA
ncbi:MAG: GMC family oxidoreductase, partial [Xanthomonadales bacterium]|nr:GMC family oxidoreductase [Xanthomonadales bacterium]